MEKRYELMGHILPHVALTGWGAEALWKGAHDMNISPEEALLWVGTRPVTMITLWRHMIIEDIKALPVPHGPIKERMTALVMGHFQACENHKNIIIQTIKFSINPLNSPLGISFLHSIINALWSQAGDKSTDFNYYTKRLVLGHIYVATLMYWLKDTSFQSLKTQKFLEKQLDFVLSKKSIKSFIKRFI